MRKFLAISNYSNGTYSRNDDYKRQDDRGSVDHPRRTIITKIVGIHSAHVAFYRILMSYDHNLTALMGSD